LKNGSTAVIEVLGGEGDVGRLVTIALTSPAVLALKNAGVTTPVVFAANGSICCSTRRGAR
jgi:hypothetical protein